MPFRIGQKVRFYQVRFNGSVDKNFFREGIIESNDEHFSYIFNVRVDRVVCNGREIPHSWAVGELGQFNARESEIGEIELLSTTQPNKAINPTPQARFYKQLALPL